MMVFKTLRVIFEVAMTKKLIQYFFGVLWMIMRAKSKITCILDHQSFRSHPCQSYSLSHPVLLYFAWSRLSLLWPVSWPRRVSVDSEWVEPVVAGSNWLVSVIAKLIKNNTSWIYKPMLEVPYPQQHFTTRKTELLVEPNVLFPCHYVIA